MHHEGHLKPAYTVHDAAINTFISLQIALIPNASRDWSCMNTDAILILIKVCLSMEATDGVALTKENAIFANASLVVRKAAVFTAAEMLPSY